MTLILSVNGPETVWMVADRRLSYRAAPPRDDARKMMLLETVDGQAILGYAGLGETASGTEPADWMSAVLRGRNVTLEHSLRILTEATTKQLPRHLDRLMPTQWVEHVLIASAFLRNKPRVYAIQLILAADRKHYWFKHTHFVKPIPGTSLEECPPQRLSAAGTGGHFLSRNPGWKRPLLHLVNAHARGRIRAEAVADHLAGINYTVHRGIGDGSVGPRCIVAWRNRRGGVHKMGGGHQYYDGVGRERSTHSLPSISRGNDVDALVRAISPPMIAVVKRLLRGEPVTIVDEMKNVDVSSLPDKPDEDLR